MDKIEEKEFENNIDTKENINEEELVTTEQEISKEENITDVIQIPEEDINDTENIIENNNNDEILKNIENKKYNKILIPVISILLIFILLLFSTIFALLNINKNTIVSGVSIKGIDVSGLTKEEAYNKVETIVNEKLAKSFTLTHNDISTTVSAQQLGANFDIASSIDTAYTIGKEKNIFINNFKILSCLIYKTDILPSFSYNEDLINTLVLEISTNFPDKLIEPSYYVENNNLIITKGKNGITIDTEVLKLKSFT